MTKLEQFQKALNTLTLCGGNKAAAARELNIPESTFKDWVKIATNFGLTPDIYPPEIEARINKTKQEYEDKITALRQQVRVQKRAEYSADNWRNFLWGLSNTETDVPKWTLPASPTKSYPGEPTLLLSDLHWGEQVRKEQVGGINEYNMEIAAKRLRTTVENTINLSYNHMVNPKYKGLVVALGGDMFSGDIHPDITESNEQKVMQCLFDLFQNLASALNLLADKFGRIFVVTAYGNHGRNTKQNWVKDAAFVNFDWVLYNMLEHHFKAAKDDRFTFKVTSAYDTFYSLMGVNYLLTHGDRLGSGGGTGMLGVIAPVTRGNIKLRSQYENFGKKIDYTLMGHYHQLLWLKNLIINGSPKGFCEFAMSIRVDPEPPQQALWFTHPERGITFRIPVFCENKKDLELKPWIVIE